MTSLRALLRQLCRLGAEPRWMSAAGVFAAAVLTVSLNVLGQRFNHRWDLTRSGVYTLSPVTVETLSALDAPLDVVVFMSDGEPLTSSVRFMLDAYASHTEWLRPRFVDPDREPAELVALQNKLGIFEGAAENGRLKNSASIVLARDAARWFVTTHDIVAYDEDAGRSRPRLEQALTEGIRNVVQKQETHVCFSTGHQELSIENGGAEGLGALRSSLERNNYRTQSLDLTRATETGTLSECEVMIIAAPRLPFAPQETASLSEYFERGGNLLLSLDPILSTEGEVQNSGLEPLLTRAGIELGSDLVLEGAPDLIVPVGIGGEVFFASPRLHDVTRGLLSSSQIKFRVLMRMARSLRLAPEGAAAALLATSEEARSLGDLGSLIEPKTLADTLANAPRDEYVVAAAVELPSASPSGAARAARLAVLGASAALLGNSFQQPNLYGNRLFAESVVSWLGARPLLVSVPEKPMNEVSLSLTEESLEQVQRYVLLYLPGTALLLGLLVLLRRRGAERAARAAGEGDR